MMSMLEYLYPGPRAGRLAPATIAASVGVIVAASLIALFLGRRPAARHGVWLAALICVLLGPIVALAADAIGYRLAVGPGDAVAPPMMPAPVLEIGPMGPRREVRLPATREPRATGPAPDRVPPLRPEPAPIAAPAAPVNLRRALAGGLTLAWGLGATVGLLRLAMGFRKLRALRRSLRPLDETGLGDVLAEVRRALRVDALPPIAVSAGVSGPVAVGVLDARVVLPEGLAETLGAGALRDVLIHECAHVLRRDPLVGLLQRLAGALHWFNPLVHHLNAQLGRSREEVCDNHVLRGGDPRGYARTLLELTERRRPWAAVGLLGPRWTLRRRVAGLLDPRRDPMTRMNRPAALAAWLLLGATCVALAGLGPRAAKVDGPPAVDVPGARVARGVVVDERGAPVAGAIVRANQINKSPKPAITAADGTFALPLVGFMLMEEDLVAEADGGARLGLGKHVERPSTGPATPVRITLKPARTVMVRVRDAQGQPVAGAAVGAVGFGFQADALADPAGLATLRIPEDAQVRWIIGLKPGVGFDYFENYKVENAPIVGPPPAEVELTLDGARTVRIKAVDSTNKPVPDVVFHAWTIQKPGKLGYANVAGSPIVEARTDARGMATFDWLPAKREQEPSFQLGLGSYSWPTQVTIDPPARRDVLEAKLLRATEIRGVARRADGTPVANLLVHTHGTGGTDHYCSMHTRTAADGSYRFEVYPEQSYILAALDDTLAARSLTGVVVREGQPQRNLDFTLDAGTVVRGRLTTGPAGAPASGKTMLLVQRGQPVPKHLRFEYGQEAESMPLWAKTDSEGRYQFRVGPGRFELAVQNAGKKAVELAIDGQAEVVRDFDDAGPTRRALSGVVLERAAAGARPLAGAIVQGISIGSQGRETKAAADAEGRFAFDVDSARACALYARDAAGDLAGFAEVAPGGDNIRVATTPAARLRGRIVDDRARPVAALRVQLRLDTGTGRGGPDAPPSAVFYVVTQTDAAGRYEFAGVPVGAMADVSVSGFDGPGVNVRGNDQRPDVRAAGVVELDEMTLAKPTAAPAAGGEVSGVVVDEQGRPVASSPVELRGPNRFNSMKSTRTDAEGRYRFDGVSPGRWTVVVQPKQHAPAHATVFAAVGRPAVNQFVVGPGTYVGGKVVGPDGAPVAGAAVGWAQPVDGLGRPDEALELSRSARTAADGTFRLGPLAAGDYQLIGLAESPRRLGRARVQPNQPDAVIRLEAATQPPKVVAP